MESFSETKIPVSVGDIITLEGNLKESLDRCSEPSPESYYLLNNAELHY